MTENYPEDYPQPTSHSQTPWGQSAQTVEHPQGTIVLILGILSLVVCALTAPFAVFFGNKARREIAEGRYAPSSILTVGYVLGWVGVGLLVLQAIFVLFYILLLTQM